MSELLYLEHLSQKDLAFLAGATGESAALRGAPGRVEDLLARPQVFDVLFRSHETTPFLHASPFLVFSVLLAKTVGELKGTSYIQEWTGPRSRVPVFDVEVLREFIGDPLRRLFLAELLASYTHVVSGSVWVRTRRGWARRRFSELDPARLAELIEVVPDVERPAVYRRLGDLALFLSGVFPDYASERLFRPVQVERIERLIHAGGNGHSGAGAIGLLERLGRTSYRRASSAASRPEAGMVRVVREMAERFAQARRILNFVTERYLFPSREQWFAPGA